MLACLPKSALVLVLLASARWPSACLITRRRRWKGGRIQADRQMDRHGSQCGAVQTTRRDTSLEHD